ncbi:MAG: hypothetical protein Q9190_007173, partial [Brigantiaea leucoxantha]
MYPTTDKSSAGSSKSNKTPSNSMPDLSTLASSSSNRDVSLQSLATLIPELVNNILNLYARAWTFSEEKLPQLAFSESGIRFSKLLVPVERSNGKISDNVLSNIVLNAAFQRLEARSGQGTTFPTKVEITAFLFRAFPNSWSDASMTTADRTVVLAGIASVLSELGYHRKKAFVLKELLSGLLPALVQARKSGAAELGVHPAASLASLDAALGGRRSQTLEVPLGELEAGLLELLSLICNSYGIVITTVSDVHSDQEPTESVKSATSFDSVEAVVDRTVQQASCKYTSSFEIKMEVLQMCINLCEALPDLGGILRFSSELLRICGSGIAPGSESSDGAPALSVDDQVRLVNKISRTVSAAKQLGLGHLEAEYWDEFLIRSVEVAGQSPSKVPRAHAKRELEVVAQIATETKKDPFLYNPFLQTSTKTTLPLLVAEEEAGFLVTVQNLYEFELEIESVELQSEGVSFASVSQDFVIGPYRTQTTLLMGTPSSAGALKITGCVAKIKGCRKRRFPAFEKAWALQPDVKLKHAAKRLEAASEASADKKRPSKVAAGPVPFSLSVDVIGVQPQVTVKAVSLPQSALMLLEGEVRKFTITLHNASRTVTADLLLLSFDDSTSAQLQAAMANKDLSATDLYELELALSKKPLRWRRGEEDADPAIAPGQDIVLEIEVVGKPGLSSGTIHVDYGHIGGPRSSIQGRFYTRQVSIPLTITVNASLDLTRTDLLPFTRTFAWQNQQRLQSQRKSQQTLSEKSPSPATKHRPSSSPSSHRHSTHNVSRLHENRFQALLQRIGIAPNAETQHCLLLLDCRNSWPTPLTISIQIRSLSQLSPSPSPSSNNSPNSNSNSDGSSTHITADPWKRAYTIRETIQPGHTSRLVLLLPRIRLQRNPYAPIPNLDPKGKRQFVVSSSSSTSKGTLESQMQARESFWFREEILKLMQATWTEERTGRKGEVNLRNVRLSSRMVNAVRLLDIDIRMTVSASPPSSSPPTSADSDPQTNHPHLPPIQQLSPSTYLLNSPPSLLEVTTTITNHSLHPIHPLVRLQPRLAGPHPHNVALDLGRKFLVQGVLQQAMPVLEPMGGKGR